MPTTVVTEVTTEVPTTVVTEVTTEVPTTVVTEVTTAVEVTSEVPTTVVTEVTTEVEYTTEVTSGMGFYLFLVTSMPVCPSIQFYMAVQFHPIATCSSRSMILCTSQ